MANSMASPQPSGVGGGEDPFVSVTNPPSTARHLRYSTLDPQIFSFGPGTSAEQAKRALQAHLLETNRKLEEVGKSGTALVEHRRQIEEQMKEVEQLQSEEEVPSELKKTLVNLERDYSEVTRETSRTLLPKQRIPSNEATSGSPFAPEGKGGRRSVSPSKFESQATGSPTKLSVPNRRLRNQPANRIHDIEFAAEISTSLISQVRNLQSLLSERDEELRDIKLEKSKLELDAENFQQRVKSLDENEHRYKDENWNLEMQLHELIASQKEAQEREKKLTQALNVLQAEKNLTQRELDEIKVTHSKLVDEHAAAVKHHDIELGTVKRNMVMAESERSAMQRKIEDLTSQNQELAKAFSSQRGRTLERDVNLGMSDEDFETATDNATPEHSPPPSPVKGTPRHPMLESETLKTSLHHAQRTIQSLRANNHREKTEKLELKRIVQDLRDEMERMRGDPSNSATRRTRKVDSREFKKPLKPGQLGGARASRSDIYLDDPDWEDQAGEASSPTRGPAERNVLPTTEMPAVLESSDHFETAHETSDGAFETANDERATETEDFQTGAEELSDDDAATETEGTPTGLGRLRRPPSLGLAQSRTRYSYHSTASTSTDEDDYSVSSVKTPTALPPQRMRARLSRGTLSSRRSRQASEEPTFQSSPASFATNSVSGTPQAAGQSLFAELGDFDGSDDESLVATPSRRSVRSMTPASIVHRRRSPPPEVPPLPKVIMVDSGTMTEPVEVRLVSDSPDSPDLPDTRAVLSERPLSMDSVVASQPKDPGMSWLEIRDQDGQRSRPVSTSTFAYSDAGAQHDPDMEDELAQFPSPPTSPPRIGALPIPILAPPVSLTMSYILAENVEPVSEPEILPPTLSISGVQTEHVEPVSEPEVPPPTLRLSGLQVERVEPVMEPEVPSPALILSAIHAESVEPASEPEAIPPTPISLSLSAIRVEDVEPRPEPVALAPPLCLNMSTIQVAEIEPVAEAAELPPAPPTLVLSSIQMEHVEPRREAESPAVPAPALSVSAIIAEEVMPIAQPEPAVSAAPVGLLAAVPVKTEPIPVTLGLSDILTQYEVAPVQPEEPQLAPPVPEALSFSKIQVQDVEPIVEVPVSPAYPVLALSQIQGQAVEPHAEPGARAPVLAFSPIQAEHLEPSAMPEILSSTFTFSPILAQGLDPRAEPELPAPALSLSAIAAQHVEPVSPTKPPLPSMSLSRISTEHVEPTEAIDLGPVVPQLGYSGVVTSVDTRPTPSPSPKRNGFTLPRNEDTPRTPSNAVFAAGRAKGKGKAFESPIIAEDDTRQSLSDSPIAQTPESQRPLKELPTNPNTKPVRKQAAATADQGAQTSLTADAIDHIMRLRTKAGSPDAGHRRNDSFGTSVGTPGTVRVRRSQESIGSVIHHKIKPDGAFDADMAPPRRPGSAASRASFQAAALPPLPSNHKQVIEAARSNSSGGASGAIGTMGPPLLPASAYRNASIRPRTPSGSHPLSPVSATFGRGTPTPRPVRSNSALGTAEVYRSPSRITAHSRQSSISSFASEVDARFNMQNGIPSQGSHGFGPNTDPRMIQAITQTMIGEYLWKYTRKAGRGELSENRHRRYFWVHPYTRTLYWSDRDPSSAGRSELRAKSVPIEAVRVVTDDNPMPPGLHRKSLVILSPGRTIKFTCSTGQRHETWFNALSYLLLRTDVEGHADTEEIAEHITSEDVDEFNPQMGRRPVMGTRASTRAPPSLLSYNSRTTRNESPAMVNVSLDVPTLMPSPKKKDQRPSLGTLSRLSGYWRSSQLGTLRSKSVGAHERSIYEASEVHDSAEDLRVMYEAQDREAARLENVRACCDGKHDVATLTKRGNHSHAHPSQPSAAPMA
ncbi:hypothetical protein RB595_005075 [Gaeumannomyces hyphopodioides]